MRAMMAKWFSRGRASFFVLAFAIAACGPRPRAAAPVSAEREDDAVRTDAEDDREAAEDDDALGALDDADGGAETASAADGEDSPAPCPTNMALVASGELRFCIDRYEASLVEIDREGNEKPYPHWLPVDGRAVRAVSQANVFPQGFISEVQAEDACAASGKRLCSQREWKTACMGPSETTFPYGDARRPGACHDTGRSAVAAVFGLRAMAEPVASAPSKKKPKKGGATTATKGKPGRQAHASTKGRAAETTRTRAARPGAAKPTKKATARAAKPTRKNDEPSKKSAARSSKRVAAKSSARPASMAPSVWTQLNDPRLGQVEGALAKTGSHDACVNDYGVFDMVGNLHEWVRTDPSAPTGTFAGGYYLDTAQNGDGCSYRTTAHAHDYHDYSTGFRCCVDAEPAP